MASSSGGSSSCSDSDSSSDSEERRRREKKERKRKREKEKKKSSKKHKHKKSKHKHKRSKHKSAINSLHTTASGESWGKHGIIKESDYHQKQEEFLSWLAEVKGVSQEVCGPRDLKEHFSSFMEDYNTATMPSEKYYNMGVWYAKEQERMTREGAAASASNATQFERTSFDDEQELRAELARERAKRSAATSMLMAKAMHGESSLVEDMRAQEAKKMQMQNAYKTGDACACQQNTPLALLRASCRLCPLSAFDLSGRAKAREIAEKLDPKYISPEELKKIFGGPAPMNSKKPGGMGGGH